MFLFETDFQGADREGLCTSPRSYATMVWGYLFKFHSLNKKFLGRKKAGKAERGEEVR